MTQALERAHIVALTRGWIGTPYRHQASLKGVGCDCLGLLRGVWREVFGEEPEKPLPYSPDWAEATRDERLVAAARRYFVPRPIESRQTGDVILFRWRAELPAKHIGVLSGPSSMIHAHDGAGVAEVSLAPWWQRRISHVFSFPGVTD